MLSFERELEQLRPLLGQRTTDSLVARERREVFSVQPEVRILAWGGAMLVATAAGLVLANNVERIGPLALAALIAAAASACYASVFFRRARASVVDDYVLLLGALLLSADAAFVESQFQLFGEAWYRHFLLLAIVHGATAYVFESRTLLSLAVVAIASWLGVQQAQFGGISGGAEMSLRVAGCLAVVSMWRVANRRGEFDAPLEHFAANFLILTPFTLMFDDDLRVTGCVLTILAAAVVIHFGFRLRREPFALYGFAYGVIAVDTLVIELTGHDAWAMFVIVVSTIAAIAALFVIHARFRKQRA